MRRSQRRQRSVSMAVESLEGRRYFAAAGGPYVVTSTGDQPAANPAAGDPTINGLPHGPVTLRSALEAATLGPASGAVDITFALPAGSIIQPASPLPFIFRPVNINGKTSSGAPGIVLNGSHAGAGVNGLDIFSGDVVQGLVIQGFSGDGISIDDPAQVGNLAINSKVENCYIGTNAAGTAAVPNGGDGIYMLNAGTCTIGGSAATGNLISGNHGNGISIQWEASPFASSNNVIAGNRIGTNLAGEAAIANGMNGVALYNNAPSNFIGLAGSGNLISGNAFNGIQIGSTQDDTQLENNQIVANKIGVDMLGSRAIPNGDNGILSYGQSTVIGGPSASERNVISGNGMPANGVFNTHGIGLRGAGSDLIEGNYIGVNAAGTAAIGNIGGGVLIVTGTGDMIGGTKAGDGNVISGNLRGIEIQGAGNNKIQGNFIGSDATGEHPVGNTSIGVYINNSPNNLIGGLPGLPNTSNPQAGNVISDTIGTSASPGVGILVQGNSATKNGIYGNFIGVDATGARPLGNNIGIDLSAPDNFVGGGGSSAANVGANVISANTTVGIIISPDSTGFSADGNFVQGGNLIGTALNGVTPLRNGSIGIQITNSNNNVIGGTGNGQGNTIDFSGNSPSVLSPAVFVTSGNGNLIVRNAMTGNTGPGILLGTGANRAQAAPRIINVGNTNNHPRVNGTLTSVANATYRIDFYRQNGADAQPQGAVWLGFTTVTTDGTGKANFLYTLQNAPFAGNQNIVATATDSRNDTSAFSTPVVVTTPLTISGVVYRDLNKDNKYESNEPGLAGFTVYIDLKNSGSYVSGDPMIVTGTDGKFTFTVPAGTYIIRVAPRKGYTAQYPGANVGYQIKITAGQIYTGVNFGFD